MRVFALKTIFIIRYDEKDGPFVGLQSPQEDISMGETVKKSTRKPKTASKTTTPAKPRKKAAAAQNSNRNGHVTEIRISHEQVAMLAHRFWIDRGFQHGHHEEDWLRAEQELLGKAS